MNELLTSMSNKNRDSKRRHANWKQWTMLILFNGSTEKKNGHRQNGPLESRHQHKIMLIGLFRQISPFSKLQSAFGFRTHNKHCNAQIANDEMNSIEKSEIVYIYITNESNALN